MDLRPGGPDPNALTRILAKFTRTYQGFEADDIAAREAACVRVQMEARMRPLEEGDLFAGRMVQSPIGFIPQSDGTGMGYCLHPEIHERLLKRPELSPENREILAGLMEFWQEEGTVYKSRRKMPGEVTRVLPSEGYYMEAGIAFTLYRMSGIQLDYAKLVRLGIPGLREELAGLKQEAEEGSGAYTLYKAMEDLLQIFTEVAACYARHCRTVAAGSRDKSWAKDLEMAAGILTSLGREKPTTFREGLQLVYLYNIFDGAKNYGRMDDYLGELYHADLEAGRLDQEEAVRLLSSVWKLMKSRDMRYDTRLIIGGRARRDEARSNHLAMAILETSRRVRENVPQLALHFHSGQDPVLYQKGLDMLAEGNTYPMLYNDEVNIPAAARAFGVSPEDAEHVIQFGCGEYVLNHRSVGTPSGVINLLQALLVTLNRGLDLTSGRPMGMPVERYLKYGNFECFEDLLTAYKEQVEYHLGPLALQEYLEYKHAAADNAYLSTSLLMDDCLSRGKGIFDGGIRHLGGTLETYGNTNVADSLVAIRQLVYEEKRLSLRALLAILHDNFEGHGKERNWMLRCPKYGNDHAVADAMYVEIHEHICTQTAAQAARVGLDSYLVVVINNDANTEMGKFTAASPDGRKAFTHLNPGHNPVGGADTSGATACLNSLVKPDTSIHAGAVQNMKFSKDMLKRHRPNFQKLLHTYFSQGGAQLMLTVISKGELEAARRQPEQYQHLMVRVGGFSERFVNLPPETQDEILSRTLN